MTTKTAFSHPSTLWKGFWGVQVLHVGQSLGLFEALDSPKSAAQLAQDRSLEPRYVQLWCESAHSYGFLERSEDKYSSREEYAQWFLESRGFTHTHLHLARRSNETLEAVFGGRALPEPQISLRLLLQENLQANYRWLFREVLRAVPAVEQTLTREGRALEVGCGAGFGLSYLRNYYPSLELFGLEADYECAQEAERSTKAVIHVAELPGSRFSRSFDLIICFRNLSAVSEPARLLSECAQLLEPGGYFLLGSETREQDDGRKSEARVQGERLAYNILAGEHLKSTFSKSELKAYLKSAGFELVAEIDAPDWATPTFVCRQPRTN
ncbi:MAG: class I SAM-dependent methyltransferase [Vulcanimicrobiota bacterium]